MIAPSLPQTIAPPAPFPLVIAQSQTSEFVAPGIRRATYRLETSDGPLIVNVVAVDPREPSVRFESVVATDRMISSGETVSSMAHRTGAVAGINADYFDIGNTNQPLNAVVKGGALLRTPSKRVVMDVRTDRSIHFENLSFSGSVAYGNSVVPLTTVNEWPPEGGATFLTSAYGSLKAAPGVAIAQLVPADPVHVTTTIAGTYRIASVGPAVGQNVDGPLLGFGPAALRSASLPNVGDSVTVAMSTVPPLENIATAVGGGPLLVSGGAPADDPNAPAPEETDVRFPVSGAATTRSGELLLATVDGRNAELSIGVTRPEFAALFVGLGATDAMAFDSGGSATLVARVLGDDAASVLNAPSDGEERAVGDGLFVYSDAPTGPPARLVVRPASILALPRVTVPVRLAVTDAAGHALGSAHVPGGDAIRTGGLSERRVLRVGKLAATVPIEIVPTVARLSIAADRRDPNPGESVTFSAMGFDDNGRVVVLGDAVRWSTDHGAFAKHGVYVAGARDAHVVANAGGTSAAFTLEVGRRTSALPYFDASHATAWHFASVPSGAPGNLAVATNAPQIELSYDFTGSERAAYATADFTLPGDPQTFSLDIRGDGSGVGVRAAFVNRFGERRALTFANGVDWNGWQTRTIALPDDLNPPVRLVALYVVDSLANGATHAAGTLAFRNASATIAGTP